ncbi:MAG TPA: response regulator [Candidatus Omnitrophota bacterium]|nr:response regulator [Candidatus Omnitrophota bacterium]HQO57990.1 response regulator [Candidatus Omnitrophota bacterium]
MTEDKIKILVVDDDPVTRHLLSRVLSRNNFEVSVAVHGQEGLAVYEEKRPHIIILDIMMPVMDGFEFVARFKARFDIKETPIIVLSSLSNQQDVFRQEGINDYIVKPFKSAHLLRKIRQRFQQRTKKILVVDDEPDFVHSLSLRLSNSGYQVVTAFDGLSALETAKRERPDLMVLDIMMPKLDGFNVCRMLKFDNKYKDMNVILLTARAGEETRRLGKQVGADACLTKPHDDTFLLKLMKELLWD